APLALQFLGCVLVADLTQYGIHRAFHRVPWLWRFHAVHHSVETMDWIAGSRLHLVDVIVTRGSTPTSPRMPLGSSAGWRCRATTTGITRSSPKRATAILPSTCR